MRLILLTTILSLAVISKGYSQKSGWLGFSAATSFQEITSTFDFNLQISKKTHLSAVLISNQILDAPDQNGLTSQLSAGIGGGLIKKTKPFILTLSGNVVWTQAFYDNPNETQTGVGFPIRLQGLASTRYLGIGLYLFYQPDTTHSFGGGGIVIGIGKMR